MHLGLFDFRGCCMPPRGSPERPLPGRKDDAVWSFFCLLLLLVNCVPGPFGINNSVFLSAVLLLPRCVNASTRFNSWRVSDFHFLITLPKPRMTTRLRARLATARGPRLNAEPHAKRRASA